MSENVPEVVQPRYPFLLVGLLEDGTYHDAPFRDRDEALEIRDAWLRGPAIVAADLYELVLVDHSAAVAS